MKIIQCTRGYCAKRIIGLTAISLSIMLLSGCMQSTSSGSGGESEPARYEYKGRIDPLTTQPVEDRTAKLSERFKLIQARQ